MRALVIADSEDWILGEIGRRWVALSGDGLEIELLVQEHTHFSRSLALGQRRADVVHFLSPWDFRMFYRMVWRPCSVTIWHMVNWASIDGFEEKWDLVTTGSEQWRQKINQHFTDEPDILRVPFGLDTHEFQPRTGARESFLSSTGRSSDTLVIGFAGKKSSDEGERKGMDRLFEIVQTLQTTLNRPILVRMIGKEWQVDDIPAPLRDIVHLEGFIAKSQLSHFYAGLDFYICTSWVEGVPYPVLEAMSCGAIALSTPVGVVPELIKSWENGVILNHESLVEDAVNSITKLSATPALAAQVRAAAREDVISKFDWQNVNVPQKLNAIFVAAQTHHANRSKQDLAKRFLLSIAAPIKHELMMQGRRQAT